MKEMRLDQILLELFPHWSRTQIQKMILAKKVSLSFDLKTWKVIDRPGVKLIASDLHLENIKIDESPLIKYVSQGALKLEKALHEFSLDVEGLKVLDLGLSTGGFSDLLLQKGAGKVLGLDVGTGQLHPRLRQNDSLMSFDKVNGRHPLPEKILSQFFVEGPREFDLIVVDVSFISLALIVPNMVDYLKKGGHLIALVKPQFELSKKDLNKKGVVKTENLRKEALEKIIGVFHQNTLKQIRYCDSPIEGDNGNKEFLLTGHKV